MGLLDQPQSGLLADFAEFMRRSGRNLGMGADAAVEFAGAFPERNAERNTAIAAGADATLKTLRGEELTPDDRAASEGNPATGFGVGDIGLLGHGLPVMAGSFGGPKSPAANLQKLGVAKKLEERGKDAETIRQQTGWQRGVDGEWRWEFSDHKAEIRADPKTGEETFHHPDLRRAYPDLHDALKIERFTADSTNHMGQYDPNTKTMRLASHVRDPDEMKRVIIHELTHPIQEYEGFSPGASPEMPQVRKYAQTEIDADKAQAKAIADPYQAKVDKFIDDELARGVTLTRVQLANSFARQNPLEHAEYLDAIMRLNSLNNPRMLDHHAETVYRRAMGEYEAREAATRRNLTPAQRRAEPPYQDPENPYPGPLVDMRKLPAVGGVALTGLLDVQPPDIGVGWPSPEDRPMGYPAPPETPPPTAQQDADRFGYGDAPKPSDSELDAVLSGHLAKNPTDTAGLMGRAAPGLLGRIADFAAGFGERDAERQQGIQGTVDATGKALRGDQLTEADRTGLLGGPLQFGTADLNVPAPLLAGTFAGQFSKTADLGALSAAKKLAAGGTDMEAIRAQTGWFKLGDGEWRYEIPDNNLKLTADGFEHPELEAAYPSIKGDTPIERFGTLDGSLGWHDPDSGKIGINRYAPMPMQRSILAHELQHKIQDREGFSPGTSATSPEVVDITNTQLERMQDEAHAAVDQYQAKLDGWIKEQGYWRAGRDAIAKFNEAHPELAKSHGEASDFLKKIHNPKSVMKIVGDMLFENYSRAQGEVEARSVQDRLDFTPEQRRNTAPFATQNIKPEETHVLPPSLPPFPYEPLPGGLLGDVLNNTRRR